MQAPGWWSGVRPIVLSVVVWLTALPGLVAAQAPAGEPIKIGAVLSLTGPGAGLGLAERSGIQRWRAIGRDFFRDVAPADSNRRLAEHVRAFAQGRARQSRRNRRRRSRRQVGPR